jgi:4-amino-4-deoxy-L-arabinose transferase-like glycosyltransferase
LRVTRIRWAYVSTSAIVAVWGLWLAFYNLAGHPEVSDEQIYTSAGWAYVHGDFSANQEHPPVAKLIMGAFQVVFGPGIPSARYAAATAGVLTGLILWIGFGAFVSKWTGLAAAAVWLLLPRGIPAYPRVDRLALLEPFMMLFATAALICFLWWLNRPAWWKASAVGAALVLAAGSKESAAILVPVFALAFVVWGAGRSRITSVAWAALGGAVIFAAVLLPPDGINQLGYMLGFQAAHNAEGHPQVVAGVTYVFQPWWANFWDLWRGLGTVVTAALVGGLILSLFNRSKRAVILVWACLGVFVVFYVLVAKIALVFYYTGWMWAVSAGAGLGMTVWEQRRSVIYRIGAAVVAAGVLYGAVRLTLWIASGG